MNETGGSMTAADLSPAKKPTFYFVGVTTGKSSIMKVFPRWAEYLSLGDVDIKGIDCRVHDDPAVYRTVVSFLKNDPLSLGALVTTHKMDLLEATADLFDELDPWAKLLGETSSISKRGEKLCGHAKDPITSGLALNAIVSPGYWSKTGAELCLLGAGGSSLALSCWLMKQGKEGDRPSRIVVTNRSPKRIEHMKAIHERINPGIPVEYHTAPSPLDNDRVLNSLKRGSLVVNATGLGKDAGGSPITEAAQFPENGLVWEFNYRGNLVFLDQAKAQKESRNLAIEDGWIYFIHGWTRVIAEVFNVDIPTTGPVFDDLCRIAGEAR
jgi:shikimate 5-dehydrogenase